MAKLGSQSGNREVQGGRTSRRGGDRYSDGKLSIFFIFRKMFWIGRWALHVDIAE